jgi:ribonucleoside-diphosphate reductase alpha chain
LYEISGLAANILNRVLDKTWWPLERIREFEMEYRPIGIGVMGLADVFVHLNLPYDSFGARDLAKRILGVIYAGAYSVQNATLLSIAPTGTIAMLAGCSYSIEPYFSLAYTKHVESGDFESISTTVEVAARNNDYLLTDEDRVIINTTGSARGTNMPEKAKEVLRTANEILWEGHLDMQIAVQEKVDNAVSKTINLPSYTSVFTVEQILQRAHAGGLKGLTVYRAHSREKEVISCPTGTCDL